MSLMGQFLAELRQLQVLGLDFFGQTCHHCLLAFYASKFFVQTLPDRLILLNQLFKLQILLLLFQIPLLDLFAVL